MYYLKIIQGDYLKKKRKKKGLIMKYENKNSNIILRRGKKKTFDKSKIKNLVGIDRLQIPFILYI